jgi:hypothetical protein
MIRFTFKYLKPVALFLAILVLFQCCKIYDKQPVTVEQAISDKRVKIITTDGSEYVFDNIYYKDNGLLYGIPRKKESQTIEIILPKEQIKKQIYDGGKPEGTDTFITVDGKEYNFDSYYFKNDTLYGLHSGRLQTEVLIPKEKIKEIYLYNVKKSKTGTVFLVIGGVVGAWALTLFIMWIILMIEISNSEDIG